MDRPFLCVSLTMIRSMNARGFHMRLSYGAVDSHEDRSSICHILHCISIGPEGYVVIIIRVHSMPNKHRPSQAPTVSTTQCHEESICDVEHCHHVRSRPVGRFPAVLTHDAPHYGFSRLMICLLTAM